MRRSLNTKAFTPSREDPNLLDQRTAGRDGLLARIQQMLLATATTKSRPHMLLVGPRGAGKSHVLEVALHRARTDSDLTGRFRVARIREDATGIASLADLLLEIVESLSSVAATRSTARAARGARQTSELINLINVELDGTPLVLVVENFNLILDALGDGGQADFRGWLEQAGNVTVLAATPLLSHAVQSRDAPLFGSFAIEHLEPLTVQEGTDVVESIARELNDGELLAFLKTPHGRARIQAIHHLAGGSPRIWTIFASVVSVDSLADVVPVVERMLEGLVTYYQQRLWALPATEQKIVNVLARDVASATVTEIAELSGVQRDSTNTILRRLAKQGWVRATKMPGLDGRESWYELTETLLRHHEQYRNNQGDELQLIVDLLIAWFDSADRTHSLLAERDDSLQAHYLAAALTLDHHRRFDAGYASQDRTELEATARAWSLGKTEDLATVAAGALLLSALEQSESDSTAQALDETWRRTEEHSATWAILGLVRWCWSGWDDAAHSAEELATLANCATDEWPTRLQLGIRNEAAFWSGRAGAAAEALAQYRELATEYESTLGPNHPDTLNARHNHAQLLGNNGQPDQAITLLEQLITDQTAALGPNHPNTLTTRHEHAYLLGNNGQPDQAIEAFKSVVTDSPSRWSSIVELARLQFRQGLDYQGTPAEDAEPAGLLRRVALDADAAAFARLPSALRSLVENTDD